MIWDEEVRIVVNSRVNEMDVIGMTTSKDTCVAESRVERYHVVTKFRPAATMNIATAGSERLCATEATMRD